MKMFRFSETTYDTENRRRIKVADWVVFPSGLHNDKITIQKVGFVACDMPWAQTSYKVFKVEDTDEFVFNAMKTKIKAAGGAEGLVDWMIKNQDLFRCRIAKLLNYAWDKMKYEFI